MVVSLRYVDSLLTPNDQSADKMDQEEDHELSLGIQVCDLAVECSGAQQMTSLGE